jgi:hypothetical protein
MATPNAVYLRRVLEMRLVAELLTVPKRWPSERANRKYADRPLDAHLSHCQQTAPICGLGNLSWLFASLRFRQAKFFSMTNRQLIRGAGR